MKATIKIQMDNAAFDGNPGWQLAEILRELVRSLESGCSWAPGDSKNLRDSNSNRVGEMTITR